MRDILCPPAPQWAMRPVGGEIRAEIGGQAVDVEHFQFRPAGKLATDGSAVNVRWKALARAGWAVVQWDPEVKGVRALYGPVSEHNPQVAVAAEHEAVAHAALRGPKLECVCDCQAVIDEWESGWAGATGAGRLYGGYWRQCGRGRPFQQDDQGRGAPGDGGNARE